MFQRQFSTCCVCLGKGRSAKKLWDLPKLSDSTPKAKPEVSGVPKDWRNRRSLEPWQRQKYALKEKLNAQPWRPITKLSRVAMEEIKETKKQYPGLKPDHFAEMYGVSPESIRRILKSKWTPTVDQVDTKERKYAENRKPYETRDKLAVRIANNYFDMKQEMLGLEIPTSEREAIKQEMLDAIRDNKELIRYLQEFKTAR